MQAHKIKTNHKHINGKIFAWMALISSLAFGMINTILPNFINMIVRSETIVTLFYAAMSIIMFFGSIFSTIIFRKFKRTSIVKFSLVISGIILFLLIFVTRLSELAVLQALRVWATLFILIALTLFVRDFANNSDLGEEEGYYYKFDNLGLLIGPLIGGILGYRFNFEAVFIIASLIIFFDFFYFTNKHLIEKHPAFDQHREKTEIKIFSSIKYYFSDKGRRQAYLVTFLLMIWSGFKIIYIPLYIFNSHYLTSMTGIVLSLGILPFVLLEVKIGKYADKKGVRLPISFGFFLMAILLFIIFLNPIPLINFALIILANIGAAFIEPLQEYTLFKNLPKKDEDNLYGVYMTADTIAYFCSALLGGLCLYFLSFKFIFLAFGTIMLLAALYSYKTFQKKTIE